MNDKARSNPWHRLEKALAAINAETVLAVLADGAQGDSLEELASSLDLELPEDFVRAYQRHDGQRRTKPQSLPIFGGFFLYPVATIAEVTGELRENFEDLEEYWSDRCIAFAMDSGGDHFCLDTVSGGVFLLGNDGSREESYPSFSQWLDQVAEALEQGDAKVVGQSITQESGLLFRSGATR